MAEKEPLIVIKKINVVQAGGHGGSWKVAFADFMTAMMAFFLVMWLISQSQEVKKNVSDYFSTPSIIEYNFANYGVELTLEKLFLDLINEPLKFFEQFIRPADYTPNVMAMGTKKLVIHHMADKLGDKATDIEVTDTEIKFEIPASQLFKKGSDIPTDQFVQVMENVNGITSGLEESVVYIDSVIYKKTLPSQNTTKAKNVAESRLDLVSHKVEARLEHPSVDIFGKSMVLDDKSRSVGQDGYFKFVVKHKENLLKEGKIRKFDSAFGAADEDMNIYDNFVKQISERPIEDKKPRRR